MYLGMTEDDYLAVQRQTPKIVADRLGLDGNTIDGDITEAIKGKDHIAFLLMEGFQCIYEEWWKLSKKATETNNQETIFKLRELISSRNAARTSLISYLNSKYGKRQ